MAEDTRDVQPEGQVSDDGAEEPVVSATDEGNDTPVTQSTVEELQAELEAAKQQAEAAVRRMHESTQETAEFKRILSQLQPQQPERPAATEQQDILDLVQAEYGDDPVLPKLANEIVGLRKQVEYLQGRSGAADAQTVTQTFRGFFAEHPELMQNGVPNAEFVDELNELLPPGITLASLSAEVQRGAAIPDWVTPTLKKLLPRAHKLVFGEAAKTAAEKSKAAADRTKERVGTLSGTPASPSINPAKPTTYREAREAARVTSNGGFR